MFLLLLFCKVFLIFKADYLAYFIITISLKWPHKYIQYTVICRTVCFCKLLLLHSGLIYRHRKTAKPDFVLLCWFQSYPKFKLAHSRAKSDYVDRKLYFFQTRKGLQTLNVFVFEKIFVQEWNFTPNKNYTRKLGIWHKK